MGYQKKFRHNSEGKLSYYRICLLVVSQRIDLALVSVLFARHLKNKKYQLSACFSPARRKLVEIVLRFLVIERWQFPVISIFGRNLGCWRENRVVFDSAVGSGCRAVRWGFQALDLYIVNVIFWCSNWWYHLNKVNKGYHWLYCFNFMILRSWWVNVTRRLLGRNSRQVITWDLTKPLNNSHQVELEQTHINCMLTCGQEKVYNTGKSSHRL